MRAWGQSFWFHFQVQRSGFSASGSGFVSASAFCRLCAATVPVLESLQNVSDLGGGSEGARFRIQGLGFRLSVFRIQVSDLGCRVLGFGFQGFGFRMQTEFPKSPSAGAPPGDRGDGSCTGGPSPVLHSQRKSSTASGHAPGPFSAEMLDRMSSTT